MSNAVSMHLFLPSEEKTAELGRKRYEELKKDLEGRGLVKDGLFLPNEDCIVINAQYFEGKLGSFRSQNHNQSVHGPLLGYNPELLLAIAGQRPEGGVGTIWKHNTQRKFCKLLQLQPEGYVCEWFCTPFKEGWVNGEVLKEVYHLATIEELIEAFPPTENAQVEPEPRKIKKGDRLLCNEGDVFWLDDGEYYLASSDEGEDGRVELVGYKDKDNADMRFAVSRFTIANDEEPVKEESVIPWNHVAVMKFGIAQVSFIVRNDKIVLQLDNGVDRPVAGDATKILREVLQRHDQLKQQ